MNKQDVIKYSENIPRPRLSGSWSEKLDSYMKGKYKENRNFRRLMASFMNFCGFTAGNLLEIGCGSGWFRKYVPSVKYFGLEVLLVEDVDMDFPIAIGAGEQLPFKDSCMDNILLLATLDHVADPKKVLEESYKVLKPGGHIYILNTVEMQDPIRKILVYGFLLCQKLLYFDIESITRNVRKRVMGKGDEYHTFEFTADGIMSMLSIAGYSNIIQEYFLNVCFLKAQKPLLPDQPT